MNSYVVNIKESLETQVFITSESVDDALFLAESNRKLRRYILGVEHLTDICFDCIASELS